MGRVWPRHGYHGRPLNLVVKRQTMQLIADLLEFIATLSVRGVVTRFGGGFSRFLHRVAANACQ